MPGRPGVLITGWLSDDRGKMNDNVGALHSFFNRGCIPDVPANQPQGGIGKMGQQPQSAFAQVVHDRDIMPSLKQAPHKNAADITRAASY